MLQRIIEKNRTRSLILFIPPTMGGIFTKTHLIFNLNLTSTQAYKREKSSLYRMLIFSCPIDGSSELTIFRPSRFPRSARNAFISPRSLPVYPVTIIACSSVSLFLESGFLTGQSFAKSALYISASSARVNFFMAALVIF